MELLTIPIELFSRIARFVPTYDFCYMLCTCKYVLQWFHEQKKLSLTNVGADLSITYDMPCKDIIASCGVFPRSCHTLVGWEYDIETFITTSSFISKLEKLPYRTIKNMQIYYDSNVENHYLLGISNLYHIETLIIYNYYPHAYHILPPIDNLYIYGAVGKLLPIDGLISFSTHNIKKLFIHSDIKCRNSTYIVNRPFSRITVTEAMGIYGFNMSHIDFVKYMVPSFPEKSVEFYTDLHKDNLDKKFIEYFSKVHTSCEIEYKTFEK